MQMREVAVYETTLFSFFNSRYLALLGIGFLREFDLFTIIKLVLSVNCIDICPCSLQFLIFESSTWFGTKRIQTNSHGYLICYCYNKQLKC